MKTILRVLGGLALATSAAAAPVLYFGQDPTANTTVPPGGNSVTARSLFEAQLSSSSVETFESRTLLEKAPIAVLGGTAVLTATADPLEASFGVNRNMIDNSTTAGRFNTTLGGDRWWQSVSDFTVTFSTATSAFGFYGTDFSDFDGGLSLQLLSGGTAIHTVSVLHTANQLNGSLLFFGFVDADASYDAIKFVITQDPTVLADAFDVLGFDDLITGTLRQTPPPNGVPEPGSLALVALSLLGLAAGRRRRPV